MTTPNGFRVLVADDEESLRGILKEVLTDAGYHVECVPNGREALALIEKERNIQVLITDIRMPEMNGIELLEKVKALDPSIQVVIMTSHGSLETAIKAIRLGAYDYLTKPFEDLDVITTVINRTVEKLRLEIEIQRLVETLKRRNEDVEALYDCTAQLGTTLDPEEVLSHSTNHLMRLGRAKSVLYFSHDSKDLRLTGRKASGWKDGVIEDLAFELKGAKVVANYFKVIDSDTELKKRMAFAPPDQTHLIPLHLGDRVDGVYALIRDTPWELQDVGLVHQFVGNVATHLEKGELHKRIEDLAIRDGLTGLYNHRHFQNTLQTEIERARRFKNKISILLFDIDHFKHYNDTNGHPAGDALLKEVGAILQKLIRKIDVAARYGGEEFIIITTETDKVGAKILAERVREAIATTPFVNREAQPGKVVSVSIGVAEFPADGDTKENLIATADKALYAAKKGGRNRVVIAGEK